MRSVDARVLAELHLEAHGLTNWRVVFDTAKRRFGQCQFGTRTISLSRPLVELNDEAEVEDVILHEIAHALAGPGHGHDRVWKAWCRKVGARPKRCYSGANVVTPEHRYHATCSECEFVYKRHRVPKGIRWCNCVGQARIKLGEVSPLVWQDRQTERIAA